MTPSHSFHTFLCDGDGGLGFSRERNGKVEGKVREDWGVFNLIVGGL